MPKKALSIFLRIFVTAVLLFVLFKHVDVDNLVGAIKNADKPLLLFGFLLFFVNYILCLFRWNMLLKAADIRLPLKRVIISIAGGLFFNQFLPSTIGGDLVRSIDLSVHTKKPHGVVATVLLDRLSGFIALTLIALFALILGWKHIQDVSVLATVAIITAILTVSLFMIFNKTIYAKINKLLHAPHAGKIREWIKLLHQEMHIFRHHKGVAVKNLLISLVIQGICPVVFYLIALSIGIKVNIIYFFIFIPIINAITFLPISIGGLGLRDATAVFFFAKVGVSSDLTFAAS
ncbi:lysylphosphatidylglycerol synthase transmembrane domain-containing protein, partial [Candidatus Omnitrophota bacterium]